MAIAKLITDRRGNVSSYFRIVAVISRYNLDPPMMTVQMSGYVDESFRLQEKSGQMMADLSNAFVEENLPISEGEQLDRTAVYTRLKTETEAFSGATDVLEIKQEEVIEDGTILG